MSKLNFEGQNLTLKVKIELSRTKGELSRTKSEFLRSKMYFEGQKLNFRGQKVNLEEQNSSKFLSFRSQLPLTSFADFQPRLSMILMRQFHFVRSINFLRYSSINFSLDLERPLPVSFDKFLIWSKFNF